MTLPPDVHAAVTRILDGAARRLLAEQLDGDTASTTPRHHNRPGDNGPDQRPPLTQRQAIPITGRVDGQRRRKAA